MKKSVRNEEVDKSILKQQACKLGPSTQWERQLDGGKYEYNQVEAHGVDERCSEDGGVRFRDNTTLAIYPFCFEENTCTA